MTTIRPWTINWKRVDNLGRIVINWNRPDGTTTNTIGADEAEAITVMSDIVRPRYEAQGRSFKTCVECNRRFNLGNEDEANEWFSGHDCEV